MVTVTRVSSLGDDECFFNLELWLGVGPVDDGELRLRFILEEGVEESFGGAYVGDGEEEAEEDEEEDEGDDTADELVGSEGS